MAEDKDDVKAEVTENQENQAYETEIEEDTNAKTTNDENVVESISQIKPLEESQLRYKTLEFLFNTEEHKKWLQDKLREFYEKGELNPDGVITGDDEIGIKIYQDYMDELCESLKNNSLSLDADKINDSLQVVYKMLDMRLSNNEELNQQDIIKAAYRRVSEIPKLQETFEVVNIGYNIFNMLNRVSTPSGIVSRIEVENKIQKLEDFHNANIVNDDQMAMGYHNIAILFESLSAQKKDRMGDNNERLASYDYMGKALRLTSNPNLIKTCFEYLPDEMGKKMLFVREACDRALAANKNDEATLLKIHTLYAKSLVRKLNDVGFNTLSDEDYKEASYHYYEALKYASNKETKAKVLRGLIKLQKNHPEKMIKTKMMLVEQCLEGKSKVRELLRLSDEVDKKDLKPVLLECAVNELIDSEDIKAQEKSLLLKNVISKLRPLYGNNKEKLDNLANLEKKYCLKPKEEELLIVRVSSKGGDYFK